MLTLISRIISTFKDKLFGAVVTTIVGGVALLLYLFWNDIVQPRIDLYIMNQINAYFSGDLQKNLPRGAQVSNVAKSEINALRSEINALRKNVSEHTDAVYTISARYTKEQLKDLGTNPATVRVYFYADPAKHNVRVIINKRQIPFLLDYCINEDKACRRNIAANLDEDITERLKNNPLTPSRGGEEDDALKYPKDLQLFQISIKRPNFEGAPENVPASIDGYIMVRRAEDHQP